MRRKSARLIAILFCASLAACQGLKSTTPDFDATVERQTKVLLHDSPEYVTGVGLTGAEWDADWGRLTDISLDHKARRMALAQAQLAELEAFDAAKLTAEQRITQATLEWAQKDYLRFAVFAWSPFQSGTVYPADQLNGVQLTVPRLLQLLHTIPNKVFADLYMSRLDAVAGEIDQAIAVMNQQAERGVVPPDFVIDRTIDGMNVFLKAAPKDNILVSSLADKLIKVSSVDANTRAAYVAKASEIVEGKVYPAYGRLEVALKALRSRAGHDAGVWHLPDGDAFYAAVLKHATTTDITPQEVFDLGEREVARIESEMDKILRAQGLKSGTVGERMAKLGADPRYLLPENDTGRQEALRRFNDLISGMYTRLPGYFSVIPPQKLIVVPAPTYAAADALGRYSRASLDGSRPGMFYTNLAVLKDSPTWSMATIAYHEGVPGHHMQNSRAQMLINLPLVRRIDWNSGYGEGWALYAERLADEMGIYDKDPLGRLGYLQAQLWRAVRLVVDSGMHAKHWSREQAIVYMRSNTGLSENNVVREIERYAVQPGQACSYMVGMLKIVELRERAKAALGDKFDLKAFHEQVLGHGALPLAVLEQVIDDWIAAQKQA
jgi:uncharacterized protein (DUF885 family)